MKSKKEIINIIKKDLSKEAENCIELNTTNSTILSIGVILYNNVSKLFILVSDSESENDIDYYYFDKIENIESSNESVIESIYEKYTDFYKKYIAAS